MPKTGYMTARVEPKRWADKPSPSPAPSRPAASNCAPRSTSPASTATTAASARDLLALAGFTETLELPEIGEARALLSSLTEA